MKLNKRITTWWHSKDQHERAILGLGIPVAVALAIYLFVVPAVQDAKERARAEAEKKEIMAAQIRIIADYVPEHGSLEAMQEIGNKFGVEILSMEVDRGMQSLNGRAGDPDNIPEFLNEAQYQWFDLAIDSDEENGDFVFTARKSIAGYIYDNTEGSE